MYSSNKWLKRDLELKRKHEEITARREALLSGLEAYYDKKTEKTDYFIGSFTAANERNHQIRKDLEQFGRDMKFKARAPEDPRFTTMKNNYWSMVKNVFPVWSEELREYKQKRRQQQDPIFTSPRRSSRSPDLADDDVNIPATSLPNTARSAKSVSIDENLPKYNKTAENLKRRKAVI
ncbi:uncharacterized protein LOC141908740 [Tubulanus polymorphus]|uniref:uncharacterized protein LOC141908740 n=1 Tax=Tubulanus polymorphus TaxID=672921 RepID=UPI003DA1EF3B